MYKNMNRDIFFVYGTVAHGILAVSYLKKLDDKHREKLIYLLAHIFITLAMLFRIDERYHGTLIPSLLGSIGHSLLLLFFIITTFLLHKKYRVSFSGELYYLNILCILAQIGMIVIYWVEYFEGQQEDKRDLKNKLFFEQVQTVVFSILAIFYLIMAFKSDNKFSLVFVGLLMISGLYIISLYRNFTQEKKTIQQENQQ
tara:strand:+ start:42 stop:638 length:597 start_codon:yes stop_codon:yes gene_type:complete